eukprot:2194948-Rhodomonas_salina.5
MSGFGVRPSLASEIRYCTTCTAPRVRPRTHGEAESSGSRLTAQITKVEAQHLNLKNKNRAPGPSTLAGERWLRAVLRADQQPGRSIRVVSTGRR